MKNLEFRVYVGTYGQYNAGSLIGKWVDLSDYSDKDEFLEDLENWHREHGDPDPELMFQDYEGMPDGYISESWIHADVWPLMEFDGDAGLLCEFIDRYFGSNDDIEYFIEQFEQRLICSGRTFTDLFNEWIELKYADNIDLAWQILGDVSYSPEDSIRYDCTLYVLEYEGDLYLFDHN